MFPIRDTIRSRTFPITNWALIAINTVVFLYEISLGSLRLDRFISIFGLVPARLDLAQPAALFNHPAALVTLVTSMFLHGGWLHLISNMWTLVIFGDNVEDRMGHVRYLVFYMLGGIIANLMQAYVYPTSTIPSIGASGAIAGVLGAYFLLFPGARVVTLILIFIFPWFIEIPAFFFLGFWFVLQIFSGLFSSGGASMGGIAWWAHIGGFTFGLLLVKFFTRPVRDYLEGNQSWHY
jgi:membrane associated rhomboid family serine protease